MKHLPSLMKAAATTASFTTHSSLSSLSHKYDAFILDQYGVMHNGKTALPGAVDCIKTLSANGKKLLILSNTSSPSGVTLARLPSLGFDVNWFIEDGVVTSGDEAARYVKETYGSGSSSSGKTTTKTKALWLTWKRGKIPDPLDFWNRCGDNIVMTTSVDEADVVLLHGCEVIRGGRRDDDDDDEKKNDDDVSLGDYMSRGDFSMIDPILQRCSDRNLPMICGNPDFIVRMPDGSTAHMPGSIGKRYETKFHGHCLFFGKPHVSHFNACLRKLDERYNISKDRVAHVGDSLHHDVAGANDAGIASVFVTGGIHGEELRRLEKKRGLLSSLGGDEEGGGEGEMGDGDDVDDDMGVLPKEDALRQLLDDVGQVPTHVIAMLKY